MKGHVAAVQNLSPRAASDIAFDRVAVPDLVYNATLINAETYRPLEVYTIVALTYFAILFPATLVARRLERGMTYDKA